MLATFTANGVATILGDDANFAGNGRWTFGWEDWSVTGSIQKEPTAAALGGGALYKSVLYNVDRGVGFRIGRSLGTLAAIAAFLKSVDALVMSSGTLVLQPDASSPGTMTYATAILASAKLLSSGDSSRGMFVTISYKFECSTVA